MAAYEQKAELKSAEIYRTITLADGHELNLTSHDLNIIATLRTTLNVKIVDDEFPGTDGYEKQTTQ